MKQLLTVLCLLLAHCGSIQNLNSEKIELKKSFYLKLDELDSISMRWVPKGKFLMGSSKDETTKHDDELLHEVFITDGFWMSAYEITQKQWFLLMKTSLLEQRKKQYKRWKMRGQGDSIPMYFISWEECLLFSEQLNEHYKNALPKGYKFSIPTEAQWEYTCKNFSLEKELDSVGWYRKNSNGKVHVIGKKRPNTLGIYDLRGNLSEWCFDWYSPYFREENMNPRGPKSGEKKVVRGGSWFGVALNAKATTRFKDPPKNGYSSVGLRLALRIVEK